LIENKEGREKEVGRMATEIISVKGTG